MWTLKCNCMASAYHIRLETKFRLSRASSLVQKSMSALARDVDEALGARDPRTELLIRKVRERERALMEEMRTLLWSYESAVLEWREDD